MSSGPPGSLTVSKWCGNEGENIGSSSFVAAVFLSTTRLPSPAALRCHRRCHRRCQCRRAHIQPGSASMESPFSLLAWPSASPQPRHVFLDSEDWKLRVGRTRDEAISSDALLVDLGDLAGALRLDDCSLALCGRANTSRPIVLRAPSRQVADTWMELLETTISLFTEKRGAVWAHIAHGTWPDAAHAPAQPAAAPAALSALFVAPAAAAPPAAAAATAGPKTNYEQEGFVRVLKPGASAQNPKPWDWEKDNQFCILDAAGVLRFGPTRDAAAADGARTARAADLTVARSSDVLTLAGPALSVTFKPGSRELAEAWHKSLARLGKPAEDVAAKEAERRRAEEAERLRKVEQERKLEEERKRTEEAERARQAEEAERVRKAEEAERVRKAEEERKRVEAEKRRIEGARLKEQQKPLSPTSAVASPTAVRRMESDLKVLKNPSRPWEFEKRYFLIQDGHLRIGASKEDAASNDALLLPLQEISTVLRKDLYTMVLSAKSVGGELVVKAETKAIADGWCRALAPAPPSGGGWV
jgi:hypothetical protein